MSNHAQKVLDSRNCYHVNDNFNITYCAYDDRQNCRSKFHAKSPDDVHYLVVNCHDQEMSDYVQCFIQQFNKIIREKKANAVRSAQLAANIRGDRDEDIRLFNEWIKLLND